jgi:hypothetical protein
MAVPEHGPIKADGRTQLNPVEIEASLIRRACLCERLIGDYQRPRREVAPGSCKIASTRGDASCEPARSIPLRI